MSMDGLIEIWLSLLHSHLEYFFRESRNSVLGSLMYWQGDAVASHPSPLEWSRHNASLSLSNAA
jgi:hypothetical protein